LRVLQAWIQHREPSSNMHGTSSVLLWLVGLWWSSAYHGSLSERRRVPRRFPPCRLVRLVAPAISPDCWCCF
jgi:hypothetical protein